MHKIAIHVKIDLWILTTNFAKYSQSAKSYKKTAVLYERLRYSALLKGIPVLKIPLVSIPPSPFSPVNVFRNTSHTLIVSIKGVKLIFATI